jgi:hypothetical protein
MNIKFRFNAFRAIAKWLDKKLSKPLSFFLKGWLYGIETAYIEFKTLNAVNKGVSPVRPKDPIIEPPRYDSKPSEVKGLDIIGYKYEFKVDKDKGQE